MLLWLLPGCTSKELTTKPKKQDITQAVYASGKLFPLHYYHVTSTIPGYLDSVYVSIGDTVQAGDTLFVVKNESLSLALDAAENQAGAAKSPIDAKTANKLKVAVKKNSAAFKKGKQLEQGLVIRARETGRVYDIMFKAGEFVAPQMPVMDIGDAKSYEVELLIDETDLNYVSAGQEVVFTAESFPNQFFEGKIKSINPKISLTNKSIEVYASINLPAQARIFAGSTVEANIIYQKEKNALVIPKIFIRKDTVWLKQSIGTKKVPVKRGIEDVEFVQILSGISENDELVKPK